VPVLPCAPVVAFAVLATVLSAPPTIAAANDDESEALIQRGIELRRNDQDAEALAQFQRAYTIRKTPRALAQIGLAEQALGKWGAADRHIRQAMEAGDDSWIRKNRAVLDQSLKAIARHVGHLDIRGTPAGAEVRIDGELVGTLPLAKPVAVAGGGVAIEVRAPGYLPIVRGTEILAGGFVRESFDLQPSSSEPARDHAAPAAEPAAAAQTIARPSVSSTEGAAVGGPVSGPVEEKPGDGRAVNGSGDGAADSGHGGGRRIVALAVAGVAVAALGFGLFEHLAWQRDVSSFASNSRCDPGLPDMGGADCHALYDSGSREKTLAFIGYGAGVVAAGAAVLIYVTGHNGAATHPGNLACAPTLTTPGVSCGLHF
jgi:hypothetical protein